MYFYPQISGNLKDYRRISVLKGFQFYHEESIGNSSLPLKNGFALLILSKEVSSEKFFGIMNEGFSENFEKIYICGYPV